MVSLVGREHELAELARALDHVAAGTGQLVFLVGEAGMGKTRLAEEVGRAATARGFAVAWGRAWEGGVTPAFWPWTQLLRALEGSTPAPELATSPNLPVERFELFDAVVRFLVEVTRERPFVIVLEDLHAADRASIALLGFVATQLRNVRALLLVTHRETELAEVGDAEAEVRRAARLGRTLPLGPLASEQVRRLARELGVGEEAADRVFRATDGNPFFACEVLRVLRARPSSGVPIPTSVRAVLRERMASLDRAHQEVVELAATLGREFAPGVLVSLVPTSADAAIAAASAVGLVEQSEGRPRFVHALVRDSVYEGIAPSRRAELHLTVAQALEESGTTRLDEVAHHYLSAGPPALPDAVRVACAAAERCTRELAYEDAVAIAERALAVVDRTSPDELGMRAALLVASATARLRAGDDTGGRRASDAAAGCARRLGSPELLARAALAYGSVLRPAHVDPLLVGMLEEALASLPEGPLRARVEARLSGALQPAFDPLVPIARARSAIASARTLDEEDRLAVLVSAGAALQDVGDAAERLALDRETLALALEHADAAVVIRVRQRLVFDYVSLGDPAAADREISVLEALVANLPARLRWPVALQRALRALCEARFDDVEAHVATARALLGDRLEPAVDRCLRLRAFFQALLADRDGDLGARWAEAAPTFHQRPLPELCLALVHARSGRVHDARAALLGASREALVAFAADPPTSLLLAEVIDAVGDAALAADVVPRVEPLAGRIAVWSWLAMTCLGPTERALGLLARARGRFDEAERWFAAAEERAERGGLPLHLARIRYERGVTLLRSGQRDRGLSCLERARASCERLGLPELAGRVTAAHSGQKSASVPPPGAARVELRREGELWVLTHAEESHRLRDSRGMQLLARLVEAPERELHVLELVGDGDGSADLGDAGELIDARAKDAYRRRVAELREDLDDAEGANDLGRAARARAELEQIEAELARAVGLGGRSRRASNATERARSNAQRRIAEAVRRIHEASPALGDHFERCLRTGIYCRYSPSNPRTS